MRERVLPVFVVLLVRPVPSRPACPGRVAVSSSPPEGLEHFLLRGEEEKEVGMSEHNVRLSWKQITCAPRAQLFSTQFCSNLPAHPAPSCLFPSNV
ncbi:MAG: hypothetical protein J3Q66DRAFT_358001 [Benniella sp.]|nr:MAG: hypothetical protein J3Q66DRAFT_358001 [Benniella sp.]